jgi:polyisoprenoid-binding protein YceI
MGAAGSSAAGGEGHDMKRGTRVSVGAAVVLVVVLAAGGFAFWQLFGGSDPPPVALSPAASSPAPTASASSGGNLDGTWTIDDTSGSLAEGTSSFAGYRVKEELAGTGANTAVGRTQNVSGSLTIDGTTITAMQVSVDMTTLQSDESRRDERLRTDGLQTDQFPTASFTLTKPIEVGSVPKDGQTIQAVAVGNLTLHGVTRSVEVSIQAQRNGDEIEAIGSVDVALTDYAIEAPTGFLVLSIANTGTIELHLLLQPA